MSCLSLAMASFCSLYSQSLLIFVGWLLVGWLLVFKAKVVSSLEFAQCLGLLDKQFMEIWQLLIIQWFMP